MNESTDAPKPGATPVGASQDAALAAFLERHGRLLDRVYGFITRAMNGGPDTGGVFLDTVKSFVGYAEKRGWDLPEKDYAPLLFRIAKWRIGDSERNHRRTWGRTEPVAHPDLVLFAGAADGANEDVIRQQDVRKALEQLTEEQVQVLILRYVDGLTLDETAAVVGGSPTRIFNITKTAKRLLADLDLLADYGPPPMRRTTRIDTSEAQA